MIVSFDPAKSERNRVERGFGFELVEGFEFATAFVWTDDRYDYGEIRYAALGMVAGRLHALVYAETDEGIRVISFRKANNRECRRYEHHYP